MGGVAFIGGGRIASCIVAGLLDADEAAPLTVAERDGARRQALGVEHPDLRLCERAGDAAVAQCDTVVLCVKPGAARAACEEVAARLDADRHLLISVVAGVTLGSLREWTHATLPVVRCMPNTPAQIRRAMSVLCANDKTSGEQRAAATKVFSAVGATLWLEDEAMLDLVTAVSGAGPAYLFRLMEAFEKAAVARGMPAAVAHELVAQTFVGAAHLALGDTPLASLRESVSSPGGVTERGLAALEAADIDAVFEAALEAAHTRSRELGGGAS